MFSWFISLQLPAVAGFSVLLTILLSANADLFPHSIPSPLATTFLPPFNTQSNCIITTSWNKPLLKA